MPSGSDGGCRDAARCRCRSDGNDAICKPAGKASNGSRNDALDCESVRTHLVDVHLSEHTW